MSQDTATHHPAAETCHTRTASTAALPACAWGTNAIAHHGVPHIEGATLAAHRRATGVSLEGKRLHSGSAVQGQRARGGEAAFGAAAQCRRMGVHDSTSARKVSCSGRSAQLVMWVHREAMKPACVCVVECLSGSVWRGGASVPPRSILFRLEQGESERAGGWSPFTDCHKRDAGGPVIPDASEPTRTAAAGCGDVRVRGWTQRWTHGVYRMRRSGAKTLSLRMSQLGFPENLALCCVACCGVIWSS